MNLPFEILKPNCKIWIYQAERNLTLFELELINTKLEDFLSTWSSHGSDLISGYTIKHNRFIIVAFDDASVGASGCSIDKLVNFIQAMGNELQLGLMDRNIAFVKDEQIETVNISQLKMLITLGTINADTPIFNNTITSKADLTNNWLVKASETWTSRYFAKTMV